jgi:hypothetical protein
MEKQISSTVYSSVDELAREIGVSRTAVYNGLRAGFDPPGKALRPATCCYCPMA